MPHKDGLALESRTGLARVLLAQDELTQAQAQVEGILQQLEKDDLSGTQEEPLQLYLTCYRILRAAEDPRAHDILTTAYDSLQERAAKISDEATRRSFLENVSVHRGILREYAQLSPTKKEQG